MHLEITSMDNSIAISIVAIITLIFTSCLCVLLWRCIKIMCSIEDNDNNEDINDNANVNTNSYELVA